MKNIKNFLEKLGLNLKEVDVYIALLKNGPMHISDIANKSKMYRPDIYKAIDVLEEKGVVSKTLKGKRTFYVPEDPRKLKNMINELSIEFDAKISELEEMYEGSNQKTALKVFSGQKGIESIFLDVVNSLKKGEVFYRYSSSADQDKTNSYLPKDYRLIRDKKQLERFVITSESVGKTKKNKMERAMKFVPEVDDSFDQNIIQFIYGSKVAFIDVTSETGMVIENKRMAEFQERLFRLLYSKL
ncbi:TrmB family transcriptional regulator [Patescibacteria group bacterium]